MNEGKKFEDNFKKSVPNDTYYLRLHDSSIGFDIENSTQRFALKSPFDCILFHNARMYCLELKSTNGKSISHSGSTPMIKPHQILELNKACRFGCDAGFIVNFRDTGNTYYIPMAQFELLRLESSKKSFNESDIKDISVEIPYKKLKVNYRYNLQKMLGGD